jgi:hypothetical protein
MRIRVLTESTDNQWDCCRVPRVVTSGPCKAAPLRRKQHVLGACSSLQQGTVCRGVTGRGEDKRDGCSTSRSTGGLLLSAEE